jgi:hypothetical protein
MLRKWIKPSQEDLCFCTEEKCMPIPNWREESVSVAGIDVHFYRGGEGPPLVLLHGGDPNPGWLQHHQALAEQFSVYAPSHPGFGHTPGLAWIATIADMALFYLWFLETGHWFRWLRINLCSTLSRFLYQEYLLEREALFQHS